MTSEEVMKLIQGDTPMKKEKIENVMISRDDLEQLLALHNCIQDILGDAGEGFDLSMSQLRDLQGMMWKLKGRYQFAPQSNEDGNPCHWKAYVLPDDDRAWHYERPDV